MTEGKIRQILESAALLVEAGWCRGWLAKDVENCTVGVMSPKAVKFCASGAILRLVKSSTLDFHKVNLAVKAALWNRNYKNGLVFWNDKKAKSGADVAALFREAQAYSHMGAD
jgi:hypothetical protein